MTSGKVSCPPGPSRMSIPAARAASCTVPGTDLPRTRRSAMPQSRTRDLGIDGHTESKAVAYVTHEHGAAVTSLGTLGTRQGDRALRLRTRPSQAQALSWVSAAGPWGAWRSRDLTTPGPAGWVVAPSRMPHQAGARVTPARRAAGPQARRARAGDRPVVDVPTGAAAARRARPRARAATLRALQDAQWRR